MRRAVLLLPVVPLLLLGTLGTDLSPEPAPERPGGGPGGADPPPAIGADPLALPFCGTAADATVEDVAAEEGYVGEVPDGLLGEGDADLQLWLVSRDTGEPVAAPVRLWRLEVPAGGGYTAGDQIQRSMEVPATGCAIEGLPEGWYRLQVDAQREGAEDPLRFWLEGGANVRHVEVAMPRTFRACLRVFDDEGREIREARLVSGTDGYGTRVVFSVPVWAVPRRRSGVGTEGVSVVTESMCGSSFVTKDAWAGPDGFELGEVRERNRRGGWRPVHRLLIRGSNEVHVSGASDRTADTTWVGIAVPIERLVARVRLPTGEPLPADRAKVTANCRARLLESPDPRAWRETFVRVKVEFPGYERLSFLWGLDREAVERVLTPSD